MIGIFDSGIGGLSVLKEIDKQISETNIIYLADSAFTPYGDKTSEEIVQRCEFLVNQLIQHGAKIIVVACNTATALAIETLRAKFTVPIVAMEPAVKTAVKMTQKGAVGILATTRTLSSQRYAKLLENFAHGAKVYEQACSGLVEKVESMQTDDAQTHELLQKYLKPLLENQVDTIVLGCTHYPFLKKGIAKICGPAIRILDTADAVTQQLKRQLEKNNLKDLNNSHNQRFITTGDLKTFQKQLDTYWHKPISGEILKTTE